MPTRAELLAILGPLAEIMPRVFFVMIAAAASLIGAGYVGRALRAKRPVRLLLAWFFVCVAGGAAYLGLESLLAYGSPASRHAATFVDPLSLLGARSLFRRHAAVCVAAVVAGPLLAALLRRARNSADASAEEVLLETRRS